MCDICVPARAQNVAQFVKVGALLASILVLGGCAHRSGALGAAEPHSHLEPDLVAGQPDLVGKSPDLVARRHVVATGETLYRVAKAYGVSPEALAAKNGIEDPRTLAVGQDLIIPQPESGDDPSAPEQPPMLLKEKERPASLVRGKGASSNASLRGDLEWPLRGVLYTRFGRKGRDVHDGIDLAAPVGTPIKAARSGTVIYAGEQRGYGLIAIIEHANGLTTLYAHNRELRVKTGQRVSDGQVIATVGESGRTTGPHLHFEVRKEGVPVDPLDHLGAFPR